MKRKFLKTRSHFVVQNGLELCSLCWPQTCVARPVQPPGVIGLQLYAIIPHSIREQMSAITVGP